MNIIETKVYAFDELSDSAKEKAREWFREGGFDYAWYDGIYDQADNAATLLGISLRRKLAKRRDGTPIDGGPAIYFSGFCSQGDGACFEGGYRYKKGAHQAVKKEFPEDTELHGIAKALLDIQKKNAYALFVPEIRQSGHYYHSGCMRFEVETDQERGMTDDAEETVRQCIRDFADWIYKRLETEWDYMNEDDQIDNNIRANEYTFTEDGRRFG